MQTHHCLSVAMVHGRTDAYTRSVLWFGGRGVYIFTDAPAHALPILCTPGSRHVAVPGSTHCLDTFSLLTFDQPLPYLGASQWAHMNGQDQDR